MQIITHHSARATFREIGQSGVGELVFTGLLCPEAFQSLRVKTQPLMRQASAVVARYDLALVAISEVVDVDLSLNYADDPCVAVIVDADHYASSVQFCAQLAELGAIRAVFLNSPAQVALAYRWAERHARIAHQELTV